MVQKRATVEMDSLELQGCHHHWMVEMVAGPTSMGICKFCGAEREFRNCFSYSIGWDREEKGVKDILLGWEGRDDDGENYN